MASQTTTPQQDLTLVKYSFITPQETKKSTFFLRFMQFQEVVDPRNFLLTKAQLQENQNLIAKYKKDEESQGSPLLLSKTQYAQLMRAQNVVGSACSRDTGEEIPRMMRMCAFVPVNVPILFGMLLSPPSVGNTIFWQCFNQSFNAGLNYGNRNASSTYTMKDLASGYTAAVGASVSMALILKKLFAPISTKVTGSKLTLINAFTAAIASGTAGYLNTFFMRQVEQTTGIEIYQDELLTQKIGQGLKSKAAAKRAINETASSRVLLSLGCLMTPAVILYAFEKLRMIPKAPAPKMALETAVFIFALMVALPGSIAMFPQTGTLRVDELEAGLRTELPDGIKTVYYNKGL